MTVYTKKGDDGKTFVNNTSVEKDHPLLEVLGNLDELNSSLGTIHALRIKKVRNVSLSLQDDLFSIGTDLAGRKERFSYEEKTKELEKLLDELSENLPTLKNFIIPGGSKHAAHLHLSRAIARRLERSLVALRNSGNGKKLPLVEAIKYINRLSDLLFVMARYVNFKLGVKERIWPIIE